MKPRHKRFILIGLGLIALAVASMLVLNAFQSNLVFFFTPTQVANAEVPKGRGFRIGGMVENGSLTREGDGLTVHFVVTDLAKRVPVTFKGILPDLFKEGKGVVAQGQLGCSGCRKGCASLGNRRVARMRVLSSSVLRFTAAEVRKSRSGPWSGSEE